MPERDPAQVIYHVNTCLIAIEGGTPVPVKSLAKLSPNQARLIASVAKKAGVSLELGTYEQLAIEAVIAGRNGTLGHWWRRDVEADRV